ncbi:YbhB/YbcL family Raf kinase inhibitor-like protein [Pajaroellobacter abortibovis]|uniref:Phosphatidylethanolamine-binding protein n=1 Tax=Pajaroellobacter abortibovis TaxID=1882918 RepID=A0A1L6MUR0_9BACT|nr:YbhB/YbcL family Raf kinase inhibitor-like protein [Pajaroellobacter abortibovis]APR99250.1 hypothetical protein BCY86_00105 [Pajaroellobacter abortibovis]
MRLVSSVFQEGGEIPHQYTCVGEDISPPLSWTDVPQGVKTFVLICDDPDAPRHTWDHWLVYNIPSDARELAENVALESHKLGINSWKRQAYGGPCPPDGRHRYYFKLYALDTELSFEALGRAPYKRDLEEAMEGHVLAEAVLMGRYCKPQQRSS